MIRINKEAAVTICFGLAALVKKSIGLKNIPPPIPTTPEINPNIDYPYQVAVSDNASQSTRATFNIIFLEFESLYNYLVKIKNKLMRTT